MTTYMTDDELAKTDDNGNEIKDSSMKYQAVKQLKTKTKLLRMCDTLAEADMLIRSHGGRYEGLSYIGSFPTYRDEQNRIYSIQGAVLFRDRSVICSLDQKELELYPF